MIKVDDLEFDVKEPTHIELFAGSRERIEDNIVIREPNGVKVLVVIAASLEIKEALLPIINEIVKEMIDS